MAKQTKKRFRKSKRKQSRSLKARNNKYRTTMKSRRKGRVVMRGGAPGDNKYVFDGDNLLSSNDNTLIQKGVQSLSDGDNVKFLIGMNVGQIAYIYSGVDLTLPPLTEELERNFNQQDIKRQMIIGRGKLVIKKMLETPELTNRSSSTITGMFENGEVSGMGTIEWFDGDKYNGIIKGNKANGQGTYRYDNTYPGKKVTGFFKDNLMTDGIGFMPCKDGHTYEGEIRGGNMDGEGKYTSIEETLEGTFQKNKKNGVFKITYHSNGKTEERTYKDDVIAPAQGQGQAQEPAHGQASASLSASLSGTSASASSASTSAPTKNWWRRMLHLPGPKQTGVLYQQLLDDDERGRI